MIYSLRWYYPHGINGPKVLQYSDDYNWFNVPEYVEQTGNLYTMVAPPSPQGMEPDKGSPARQEGHNSALSHFQNILGRAETYGQCKFSPKEIEAIRAALLRSGERDEK